MAPIQYDFKNYKVKFPNYLLNDGKNITTSSGTFSTDLKIKIPVPTYIIHVSDSWCIECVGKPPAWIHRKMMKLVFGWDIKLKQHD